MTWDGERYQERFEALAASGVDVHGEADFAMRWAPSSVLDAGCGTGRVARELERRGVDVVGVDRDESMIAAARRHAPDLTWVLDDLSRCELGRRFEMVLMAGNVLLFTPEGSQAGLVAGCARHLAPDGYLLAGFELGRGYGSDAYDEHCRLAGLSLTGRWATWSGDPFTVGSTYAVSLHRSAA